MLNSKLGRLERQMELIEATLESVDQEDANGGPANSTQM